MVGSQQAPTGGHGFGSQVVFGPIQVSGGRQFGCVVTVQAPVVGLQQAPFGCGQGFGVQVVFGPSQLSCGGHSAWVVRVQLPVVGSQHAPSGGQGLGEQVVPGPIQYPLQLACVVSVQLPVAGSQQAPFGCGHGFGSQTGFGPCHTSGGRQLFCVVTVQAPVAGSQQAPVGQPHGRGTQTVPGPIQLPVQLAWVVTVQVQLE